MVCKSVTTVNSPTIFMPQGRRKDVGNLRCLGLGAGWSCAGGCDEVSRERDPPVATGAALCSIAGAGVSSLSVRQQRCGASLVRREPLRHLPHWQTHLSTEQPTSSPPLQMKVEHLGSRRLRQSLRCSRNLWSRRWPSLCKGSA